MKTVHIHEFNQAITKLEQAIRDSRFIKSSPEVYQKVADNIRTQADYLAGLLESEIPQV